MSKLTITADELKRSGVRKPYEVDPAGLAVNAPGAKLDANKPRVGLVLGGFPRALLEVSKVGTCGAAKYSDNGWKAVLGGEKRYTDAMLRHFLYESNGEVIDPDFGLLHAAHLAWNAMARLEFILETQEKLRNTYSGENI